MDSSHLRLRPTSSLLLLGTLVLFAAGCGTTSHTNPASPAANHAAPNVAAGPTLGFVWDSSDATLRPLSGVPGAALMGTALAPAGKYSSGAASVRLQVALFEDAGGDLWSQQLGSLNAPQQLASGQPQGLRFAFAPTLDSAVAYARGAGSVLQLSGLRSQPTAETVSVPAGLLYAAVSDTGTLLIAASTASGAALETRSSGNAFGTPIAVAKFGGAAFLSSSSDALYADAASNTVYRLHGASSITVAGAKDGVKGPAAVAASIDGHWAGVVNSADGSLLRIDLSGAQPAQRLTCTCTPSTLSPLSGNGVFLMTDARTDAPTWALDVAGANPRTFFVPALQTQGTAGGR